MATNPPTGDGHRNGAVRNRSQVHNPQNDRKQVTWGAESAKNSPIFLF